MCRVAGYGERSFVDAFLDGSRFRPILDTGASRSLIPISLVKRMDSRIQDKMQACQQQLMSYCGGEIYVSHYYYYY